MLCPDCPQPRQRGTFCSAAAGHQRVAQLHHTCNCAHVCAWHAACVQLISCACLPGCRQWGGIAYALMPQLCRLAETAGQVAPHKQHEMLGHLLSCLRQFAEMGLADEAVRAGGGRLLATTTELYLVSALPCALRGGEGAARFASGPCEATCASPHSLQVELEPYNAAQPTLGGWHPSMPPPWPRNSLLSMPSMVVRCSTYPCRPIQMLHDSCLTICCSCAGKLCLGATSITQRHCFCLRWRPTCDHGKRAVFSAAVT